jgi:hypothetical protein
VVPKHVEPVSKDAMTVQLPAAPSSSAPPPQLFDKNGQALLPATSGSAPVSPEPGYVQGRPTGDTQIMQTKDVVKYQSTRFNGDWGKGNVVDRALQKAVDKTTVTHTFNLPGACTFIAVFHWRCWPAAAVAIRPHRHRRRTATSV